MQKKCQSGRSLVEMLGVLAIIGVLSVGAIGGYNYAMNRYRANEILKGVSARAMTASMEKSQTHTLTLAGHEDNINGYVVGTEAAPGEDNGRFAIKVAGVPEEICGLLLENKPEQTLFVYGGDGTAATCSDGENTVAFVFNDNLSTDLKANDYNGDESGCTGAGYTLCADDTCRADCCAGVDTTCQTCASDGTTAPKEGSCTLSEPGDGVCSNGSCVADPCYGVTCDGHASCSEGDCVCDTGWGGDDCSEEDYTGVNCTTNAQCGGNGSGWFCAYLLAGVYGSYSNVDCRTGLKSGRTGQCFRVEDYKSSGGGYTWSTKYMNWFSAENFCAAQNKDMPTIDSFNCYKDGTSTMFTNDMAPSGGFCCKEASGQCSSYWFYSTQRAAHFSSKIVSLKETVGEDQWFWTQSLTNDSCYAFDVNLANGYVRYDGRNYGSGYALCE